MKKVFLFAALLAGLGLTATAWAGTITIKNNMGGEIVNLYVSDSGTNDWEEDVLGQDTLKPGDTLNLTVNGSYSSFDIRITDGVNSMDFFGLPGQAANITLNPDGTASY